MSLARFLSPIASCRPKKQLAGLFPRFLRVCLIPFLPAVEEYSLLQYFVDQVRHAVPYEGGRAYRLDELILLALKPFSLTLANHPTSSYKLLINAFVIFDTAIGSPSQRTRHPPLPEPFLSFSPPSDPSSRLLLIKQLVNQFASKKRRLSRASADLEILLFANFN